jgi:hypothetical protein
MVAEPLRKGRNSLTGQCALETDMDKKIAGLLGAVAALGGLNAAQAAPALDPTEILRANSFAELLEPIPNAAELLRAVDAQPPAEAVVHEAQYYPYYRHHHHHHAFYPRYYAPYGGEVVVVPRYRRYYRHHHHHGYYRSY